MADPKLAFALKATNEATPTLNKVAGDLDRVGDKADGAGGKMGKLGGLMGGALKAGMLAGGAAIAGAGFAVLKFGGEFDAAFDKIRVGTGATGEALDSLEADFKSVLTSIPTNTEDASTAIADLNTRLGLTGEPLRDMSKQILELSRITDTDLGTNVEKVTRLFGDWGDRDGESVRGPRQRLQGLPGDRPQRRQAVLPDGQLRRPPSVPQLLDGGVRRAPGEVGEGRRQYRAGDGIPQDRDCGVREGRDRRPRRSRADDREDPGARTRRRGDRPRDEDLRRPRRRRYGRGDPRGQVRNRRARRHDRFLRGDDHRRQRGDDVLRRTVDDYEEQHPRRSSAGPDEAIRPPRDWDELAPDDRSPGPEGVLRGSQERRRDRPRHGRRPGRDRQGRLRYSAGPRRGRDPGPEDAGSVPGRGRGSAPGRSRRGARLGRPRRYRGDRAAGARDAETGLGGHRARRHRAGRSLQRARRAGPREDRGLPARAQGDHRRPCARDPCS